MATRRLGAFAAPLALIAATLAVLVDRSRHEVGDRAVLLAVIAASSWLNLKDRRLIAAMLAFAVATWAIDAEPPSLVSAPLRAIAESRAPEPLDFHDPRWTPGRDRAAVAARVEVDCRLYSFALLNALAFAALLTGATIAERTGAREG